MLIPVHIRHVQQKAPPVFTEGYVNPLHVQTVTENIKGDWCIQLRNQVTLHVDVESARRVVEAMNREGAADGK